MSIDDNHINQKIASTLQSIDEIKRAEPAPFLMTRINAAMAKTPQRESIWATIGFWLSRPAIAVSLVMIFLALNMLGIFVNKAQGNDTPGNTGAYEYLANVSSNYEFVDIPQ